MMTTKYMVVVQLTNGNDLYLGLSAQDESHAALEAENKILHGLQRGEFTQDEIKAAGVAYHLDYQIQKDDRMPVADPDNYGTIH